MRMMMDLCRLTLSQWRHSRRLIALTTLNLSIGLCILLTFMNTGYNISRYVTENFFSGESVRHILIWGQNGNRLPSDGAYLQDARINAMRIIYDSNLTISTVNDVDYTDVLDLDLSVLGSDSVLFEGEYEAESPFTDVADGSSWRDGVVVSARCLIIFGDESPLGQIVRFSYQGQDYELPITAIISSSAESNYTTDYQSFMYVWAEDLSSLPTDFSMVELRLERLENVKGFVTELDSSSLRVDARLTDVAHILGISTVVTSLLILCGLVFALAAALGVVNFLRYMQDIEVRSFALLRVTGFARGVLVKKSVLESVLLSILGDVAGIALFSLIEIALVLSKVLNFQFISTAELLHVNWAILLLCFASFLSIVIASKLRVIRGISDSDSLELLRSER